MPKTESRKTACRWHWSGLINSALPDFTFGLLRFIQWGLILPGLCFVLSISGCRSLAPIEKVGREVRAEAIRHCEAYFISRPVQLVQSMTAYMPGGNVRNAIAVVRIHPGDRRVKCVIMSVEGIVLFEGEYDEGLSISRAVSPFDKKEFANAVFSDIRLALMPPGGEVAGIGRLADGTSVCRYKCRGNNGFTEVRLSGKNRLEIKKYNRDKKLLETVKSCYPPACSSPLTEIDGKIPARINILHHGFFDYRLELNLLETNKLPQG